MAACIRLVSALRKPFQSVAVFPVTRRLTVKYPRDRLTWSQLRFLHSQSTGHFSSSVVTQPSRSRWRWLVVMATAGFSQGFLGFNFGKKDEEEEKGGPLKRVYMEAQEARMKQDFYTAEIRYHDAIKVADELFKLKKINFKTFIYAKTNIYDSLADMALGRGELEKAEKLYKETMKGCLQQGASQTDNSIVELSLKLASIYAMLDRLKEAEQGLLFCINTQDAKLSDVKKAGESLQVSNAIQGATRSAKAVSRSSPPSDRPADEDEEEEEELLEDTEALLGMALETYGRLLMGQRRLPEAVETLERARGIAGKVLGTHTGQYVILVNDLATAHMLLKNYDKATDILNKAIKSATETSATETESSHLPMLYCNLGAAFLRTAKLREAEEACRKGKELSADNEHSMAAAMSKKCLEKIAQVKKAA